MPAHQNAQKPLDRWLAIGSLVVGNLLFLAPRTPFVIAIILLSSFLLSLHPIWNFWWIENSNWRRFPAIAILAGAFVMIAFAVWPAAHARLEVRVLRIDVVPSSPFGTLMAELELRNTDPSFIREAVVWRHIAYMDHPLSPEEEKAYYLRFSQDEERQRPMTIAPNGSIMGIAHNDMIPVEELNKFSSRRLGSMAYVMGGVFYADDSGQYQTDFCISALPSNEFAECQTHYSTKRVGP